MHQRGNFFFNFDNQRYDNQKEYHNMTKFKDGFHPVNEFH